MGELPDWDRQGGPLIQNYYGVAVVVRSTYTEYN